ncbi:EF-hand domain-containing protein [Dyella sp. A6]|uniref:EF-hand domain-containing protein n=1 Tax=Dyella aluminiiresistens TaxID=3069105 RepID=UPI002E768E75|nr:EF-hand domain-containing protein [Dyella sp. A6]
MPRTLFVIGTMLTLAGLPATLPAQTGLSNITRSVAILDKNFEIADRNHDGELSLKEAQDGPVPFIARNFAAIDTAHTGLVSKKDVHAYIARMLMRSQPKPGPVTDQKH